MDVLELYDWQWDDIESLRDKYKVILFQLPEGLRRYHIVIAERIEKLTNATAVFSAEPCYGACDLPEHGDMSDMGGEMLIHFGHTEFRAYSLPVIYIPLRARKHPTSEDVARCIVKEEKTALLSTIQYTHILPKICKELQMKGYNVFVPAPTKNLEGGQVLGCSFGALDNSSDAFLYIGTGKFHPLGIAIISGKTVRVYDPVTGEVSNMNEEVNRFLRQRHTAITIARDAETFLLLSGLKTFQRRSAMAIKLRDVLKKHGKKSYIIAMRDLRDIEYINGDVLVSLACPRLAIDDYMRFNKPIITPIEVEIALNLRKWEEYKLDYF